ncbi:MAG: ferritin [Spirochaetota bacterium]|nr:ferritin [Spirochaetota bacterium]
MLSNKMEEALNKQINAELYSAYLYLAMAAYFESTNLSGFAKWMEIQAEEEKQHAMKLYHYIVERGGRVVLDAIQKPQSEWKSPLDVFEAVYTHEQHVTSLIYNLADIARQEKDYATEVMLHWFIKEQVEEEANASSILERIKMVKDSVNGILQYDKILGKRGSE